MRAFFVKVIALVPDGDDLLLVGDGEVVGHLADKIRAQHSGGHETRRIEVDKSDRVTTPQMLARMRAFAGQPSGRQIPR
jgi:hypothetical protein